jgi:hypothetical protein
MADILEEISEDKKSVKLNGKWVEIKLIFKQLEEKNVTSDLIKGFQKYFKKNKELSDKQLHWLLQIYREKVVS